LSDDIFYTQSNFGRYFVGRYFLHAIKFRAIFLKSDILSAILCCAIFFPRYYGVLPKLPVVKLTARIIREHNNICNDILKYEKFWKSFYFVLTYAIIPINLMCLQQLLFDDIVLAASLIYSFVGVVLIYNIESDLSLC
jgi:hypothetical protein